jgi:hypothetical protein
MITFRSTKVFGFVIFFICCVQLFLFEVSSVRAEGENGIHVTQSLPDIVATEDAGGTDVGPTSVLSREGRRALENGVQQLSPGGILAWTQGQPYPLAGGIVRYAHAQCSDQPNSFYVISGVSNMSIVANAYRYDADTNMWWAIAPLPVAIEGPSATCYQGKIYVAGGSGSTNFFVYDIASNTWATGPALPRPVWGAAMGSYLNKVFLAGGDADFMAGGTSSQVDVFSIDMNTWNFETASPMPIASHAAGFTQAGKYLYVVGGWGDSSPTQNVTATQRYDMSTNTWTTGPTFTSARGDFPLAATATRLYAMGGDANGGGFFDATALVEYLDYTSWPSGAWADALDPLPAALTAHGGGFCTNAVSGGEVWSTGGMSASSTWSAANQYKTAQPCYVGASLDGQKILYYVDYEYVGHDTFYGALASMGLLLSTTVVHGDAAMLTYLSSQGWHLVVTLIQNSPLDRSFASALIDYVEGGGKAILADWRKVRSVAEADTFATAFQGSYTGNFNPGNIAFTPDSMLWYGLVSPIDIGLPSGVSWGTYAMGLNATGSAVESGIFPNGDAAIVIGNNENTILNGFLQDVFLDWDEGIYFAANELRYLLYNLNVAKTGTGGGTVVAKKTPINCGTVCGADFSTGQIVKLSAKANKGSKFTGWSGACTGTKKTCSVTIGRPGTYKGVTATFGLK